MSYQAVLLTGATGKLGRAVKGARPYPGLLAPTREEFDLARRETLIEFFSSHEFDAVIHCAALARIGECETQPVKAIETNLVGTAFLVAEVLKKEEQSKKAIRFIHISTDGVYPGALGNYSEEDPTIPYNRYGWTKLGAECSVNLLRNYCVIRTNYFDPRSIRFEESADNIFTSKMMLEKLAEAVWTILESDFVGTINIGDERKSDFERYRLHKPSLRRCSQSEIYKSIGFRIASDSSMNCDRWKKLEAKLQKALTIGQGETWKV